tara:strand:- start:241 stop:582 length:342 start_codon:yes stop_codon:yes gene_type:complete
MSEVAEANPIQDLIQNTIDQNYTGANGNFMDIMTLKLNDVLDQEKIRLADQIYNGIEDGQGDEPDEDEQLELDLDGTDEEVFDEPSDDQDFEEDGYEVDDEAEDQFEEEEDEE